MHVYEQRKSCSRPVNYETYRETTVVIHWEREHTWYCFLTTLNVGESNVTERTTRFPAGQSTWAAAIWDVYLPSHHKSRMLRRWKINGVMSKHEHNRGHVWSIRSAFLHAKQPNVYALYHVFRFSGFTK